MHLRADSPLSRLLPRLPALVAAAAYLAAAVGGTGLHGLTGGGHAHCGHDHGGACSVGGHAGHDHAGHDHAGHDHAGHDHAGHDHAGRDHGDEPHPCGTAGPEDASGRTPAEPASPAHDPHHCAVCQFLAMGQQVAEAPEPVDVAGPTPSVTGELSPSVGSEPALTERVRGPPAAV